MRPLLHPSIDDVTVEAILHALSDPVRRSILQRLQVESLLVSELAEGGRLVIPVGGPEEQELAVVRRQGDHYVTSYDTRCRYVDLQGRFGVGGGQPAA